MSDSFSHLGMSLASMSTTEASPNPVASSSSALTPSILSTHDGKFQLNLTNMNLSAADLATITTAFNQAYTSYTPASSNEQPSLALPPPPLSSDAELVMKTQSHRRRTKLFIVAEEDVIQPENIVGDFTNLSEEEFEKLVYDNESAIAFAAKVGLVQNIGICTKCHRHMSFCKFNNSCGYRWVCRRTENAHRFTCSVRGIKKGTFLDDRSIGILPILRMLFLFSKNVSDADIISRLNIAHIRSARTILNRFRQMVEEEVVKLSKELAKDSKIAPEHLRQQFLTSVGINHFGFICFWGARSNPSTSNVKHEPVVKKESSTGHQEEKEAQHKTMVKQEIQTDDKNEGPQLSKPSGRLRLLSRMSNLKPDESVNQEPTAQLQPYHFSPKKEVPENCEHADMKAESKATTSDSFAPEAPLLQPIIVKVQAIKSFDYDGNNM